MQTRSQVMKRPASEDIAVSPSKSPRRRAARSRSRGNEEDEPISRRTRASSPQLSPVASGSQDGEVREDGAGPALGQSSPAEPQQDDDGPQSLQEVPADTLGAIADANADAAEAGKDDEPENRERENDERKSDEDPENGEEGNNEEQGDAVMAQRIENKTKAIQLLMQLLFTLERWQILEEGQTMLGAEPVGMQRLCELGADPELSKNEFLKDVLPFEFYWEMQEVKKQVTAASEAKEKLRECEEDVRLCNLALNNVLIKRAYGSLELKFDSEEAIEAHNRTRNEAFKILSRARSQRKEAQEEWDHCLQTVHEMCRIPFNNAVEALVEAGKLLPALEVDQNHHGYDTSSERYSNVPESVPADDAHPVATHDAQYPMSRHERSDEAFPHPREIRGRSSIPARSNRRNTRSHEQGRSDSHDRPPGLPRIRLVDNTRTEQREDLEQARQQLLAAENKFHSVRRNYHRDLDKFLRDRERDDVAGSITEFDQNYFLARGRANRKVGIAQQHWLHALDEAETTEALTQEMREAWCKGDNGSDHGSGAFRDDEIWKEKCKGIETWRNDEGMGEVGSERHWPGMVECIDDGGTEVDDFETLDIKLGLYVPGSRDRRQLDEWQAEQAKMRTKIERDRAREEQAEEEPLPWWQVWDGI